MATRDEEEMSRLMARGARDRIGGLRLCARDGLHEVQAGRNPDGRLPQHLRRVRQKGARSARLPHARRGLAQHTGIRTERDTLCLAVPCCALLRLVLSCLVLSCLVLPCLALSYLVLPCLALSCLVFPRLSLYCCALPCLTLSCLVLLCFVVLCCCLLCLVVSWCALIYLAGCWMLVSCAVTLLFLSLLLWLWLRHLLLPLPFLSITLALAALIYFNVHTLDINPAAGATDAPAA